MPTVLSRRPGGGGGTGAGPAGPTGPTGPTGAGSGGLPEGWEQSGDPAALVANEGSLLMGIDGENPGVYIDLGRINMTEAGSGNDTFGVTPNGGCLSQPTADAAFRANDENGATVAFDAGELPIVNLPTVDPGIAGALWNDSGTPAISTG